MEAIARVGLFVNKVLKIFKYYKFYLGEILARNISVRTHVSKNKKKAIGAYFLSTLLN